MKNNTLAIALSIGGLALVTLCCFTGIGGVAFLNYRQQREASAWVEPVVPTSAPMPLPPPPSVAPSVPAPPSGSPLTVLPTSPVHGLATAPVTMHIISDFQCPFCNRVVPTVHELMTQYEGRVRFVWHDYPLPFHENAMVAAEAAQEVHRQLGDDAFWSFHDTLFANQSDLSPEALNRLASQVPGIDLPRFQQALRTEEHLTTIRSDMAQADLAHPSGLGTPSFSVNGTWISGAQPIDAFRTAIDAALAGH
jgi:protein-disulfide isomerase